MSYHLAIFALGTPSSLQHVRATPLGSRIGFRPSLAMAVLGSGPLAFQRQNARGWAAWELAPVRRHAHHEFISVS